jgi:hypothetical protein
MAASIAIEAVGKFFGAKQPQKPPTDERTMLRWHAAAWFLLAGLSSYDLGDKLGCDPSALRKRFNNDLAAIENEFGHFCNDFKLLMKIWPLPQNEDSICYTTSQDNSSAELSETGFDVSIDPDFGDPKIEILTRFLFA